MSSNDKTKSYKDDDEKKETIKNIVIVILAIILTYLFFKYRPEPKYIEPTTGRDYPYEIPMTVDPKGVIRK